MQASNHHLSMSILSKNPSEVDPNRQLLPTTPQDADKKTVLKVAGISLLVLAALSATIALTALSFAFTAAPLAGFLTTCGIAGAVSFLAGSLGTMLLKKGFENDQAYLDSLSLKAQQMNYESLLKNFTDEQLFDSEHIVSKKYLKEKLVQQLELVGFKEFKNRYLDKAMAAGIMTRQDPWLKQSLKEAVRALPYHEIVRDYSKEIKSGLLSRNDLIEVIKDSFKEKTCSQIILEQGGFNLTWKIFEEGLLPLELFTKQMKEEINQGSLSIQQVLKRYGWGAFETGLLKGKEFNEQCVQELADISFVKPQGVSEMERYLGTGLLTLDQLRCKLSQEILNLPSIQQVIDLLGTEVFEKGYISGDDPQVQKLIKEFLKTLTFSGFVSNSYVKWLKGKNMIPQELKIDDDLILKQAKAKAMENEEIKSANDEYTKGVEKFRQPFINLVDEARYYNVYDFFSYRLSSFDKFCQYANSEPTNARPYFYTKIVQLNNSILDLRNKREEQVLQAKSKYDEAMIEINASYLQRLIVLSKSS